MAADDDATADAAALETATVVCWALQTNKNTRHFSPLKIAVCKHKRPNIIVCTRVVFLKLFRVSCMYRVCIVY